MALARWPSGLRRQTKDPGHLMTTVYLVRKGVGSNPTLVTFFFFPFPQLSGDAIFYHSLLIPLVRWPSGLRRQTKDQVIR